MDEQEIRRLIEESWQDTLKITPSDPMFFKLSEERKALYEQLYALLKERQSKQLFRRPTMEEYCKQYVGGLFEEVIYDSRWQPCRPLAKEGGAQ